MACEARAAKSSLICTLEMILLRIEPRNFEYYLYSTIYYISFHLYHYLVTKVLTYNKIYTIIMQTN